MPSDKFPLKYPQRYKKRAKVNNQAINKKQDLMQGVREISNIISEDGLRRIFLKYVYIFF